MKIRSIPAITACLVFLAAMAVGSCSGIAKNKFKPQQFKVTVCITYNTRTLEQAAALEKKVHREFGDACSIKMDLTGLDQGGWLSSSGSLIIPERNN